LAVDVRIVRVEPAHVDELARRMRPDDVAEVKAASGATPDVAVALSVWASRETWSVFFDGELVCIWGVCPAGDCTALSPRGWVWMLTTDTVEKHKRQFWKCCWDILPDLFSRWDLLANYIDARHEVAIRWGHKLGFQFREPAPFGVEGLPFRMFTVTKENVACAQSKA